MGENRERLNYYQNIQPLYPKICKRYKEKDVSQMQECIKEVRKTLPVADIKLMRWNGETGETIGYIVGPAYDSELPKFLRGLQLMTKNAIKPDGCIAGQVALDSTRAGQKETLRLFSIGPISRYRMGSLFLNWPMRSRSSGWTDRLKIS